MARSKKKRPTIAESGGFTNWLNNSLRPYIGPPPLGPYNEDPLPPATSSACPICGSLMSDHIVDRSGERTQLYCPTPDTKRVGE
ncbi:hypothetical protein [Mycetocola zhadangensis]|uniref:Type IV secretion protein Rhs n=1 Tax=Mycetocola zhadangensis TaxID=1164595 RepID=A0A3L7ISG6_9MICO|nr:hypothetical protein [Mycetocola zhadangensis]RLQ81168.1 hypothetical protein D9V28_15645 [Mycetocola zhadangensis]GGF05326.1 hypothetical protein GCM10011313_30610 [Mycetocola zhadangensis]